MTDQPVLPFVFENLVATERLILRLQGPEDADDVFAYQSLEEVTRYQLFDPRSRDEVVAKLTRNSTATTLAKEGDYLQLALEPPGAAGAPSRVIGDSFFSIASIENSRGEIGWSMHPDFTGKGYASEAARAILDIAFRVIGLHRVVAELDPRNAPSIALCRRLGMREEAYFVKDLMFKGEWADTGMYAILRDEWMAASAG